MNPGQDFLKITKISPGKEDNSSNSKYIPFEFKEDKKETENKIGNNAIVDAVFMCDCTSSMGPYLEQSKEIIKKMIQDIRAKYINSSVFVGFIAYRDHCDTKVLETLDLTSDFEEVYKFIGNLQANGGGDFPEAVVDGLNYATNQISWRSEESLRLLIQILDATPHGKEFGGRNDKYPQGCPCKLDYKMLLKKLSLHKVQYLILKVTPEVSEMIRIFKTLHDDCEEIDISNKFKINKKLKYKEILLPPRPACGVFLSKNHDSDFSKRKRTRGFEKKSIINSSLNSKDKDIIKFEKIEENNSLPIDADLGEVMQNAVLNKISEKMKKRFG